MRMFIGCNAPLKVDNHKDEEDGYEVSNCQGGERRGHKRLEQDDEWRVREVRQRGTNKLHCTLLQYTIRPLLMLELGRLHRTAPNLNKVISAQNYKRF